jgi:hypothetical protein
VGRYGVRTEGVRTEPRRVGIGGALLWRPDATVEGKGKGGPVLKGTGQRVAATRHGEVMEGGGVRCQLQTRGRGGDDLRSVRQGTATRGPAGRSGGGAWATAAVGSAHKNSNIFDLFKGIPERSDLI